MLWLCIHFPHLPVELRQPADEGPCAVVERYGQRRRVVAANAAARAEDVQAPLDVTVALARAPALRLIERSPAQERKTLKALGAWIHQWSSDIAIDAERWLITLEVAASLRYFGGLDPLHEQLLAGLGALGYTVRTGIAPTREAAALLARSTRPATPCHARTLRKHLCGRPLSELAVPDTVHRQLHEAGLRTIGDVLDIPRPALARRFGDAVTDYLQRLLGERPDPYSRFRIPTRYRRALECSYPVDSTEALLFPLRRMLQELEGYLRGRDVAVQTLSVTLGHHEQPPTHIELRTSTPRREAAALFALLRERLDRLALPAPATDLVVEATRFVAPATPQADLFEQRQAHDAHWSQLLDRLRARLGEDAIRELHLRDDHRPARAWGSEPSGFVMDPAVPLPERPVWILDPKPLRAPPKLLGHPERIEAGWWEDEDERRDYYLAETPRGALWWVHRDLHSKEWFLQGIWA